MILTKDLWPALEVYLLTERKIGKNTLKYTKYRYKLLVGYFHDKEFNRANFNEYIYGLKLRGLSNAYINNLITLAKNIDKWKSLGQLEEYTYWKKERKAVQPISPEQILEMANLRLEYPHHDSNKLNQYWCTAILFLALTGCRVSEMRNLLWKDCTSEVIVFRETKNGDDRSFPMPPLLWRNIDLLERKGPYVFCARAGSQIDPNSINKELKRRASEIGIDSNKQLIYNHILRHSFITEMLKPKHKLSDSIVAALVGHKSTVTTHQYNHPQLPELENALFQHPILKKTLSKEMIITRFKELSSSIVDLSRFNLTISENDGTFSLELEEL